MDAEQETLKPIEVGMSEKKATRDGGEVVIVIPNDGTHTENGDGKDLKGSAVLPTKQGNMDSPLHVSSEINSPSPEFSKFSPSLNKPPKIPTGNENLVRRKSMARLVSSKPKSRFVEETYVVNNETMFEENDAPTPKGCPSVSSPYTNSFNIGSPDNKTGTITRMVSIASAVQGVTKDDDEDIVQKLESSKWKRKRLRTKVLLKWIAFFCITVCLVASLTVEKLVDLMVWGLEVWKWCLLVMVIFFGMLVTKWCMRLVVFLIELNFLLKKKVLYFVYGLKQSVQVFIWIGVVLLSWVLLIERGVERSQLANKILDSVTWTLVSLLIGAFLWLLKTLLLKILASNFHVNTFFDRIQESIFHQYVLRVLSGPPLIEEAERVGRSASTGQFSFRSTVGKGKTKKEVIDIGKLHKMKQEKVSAWTMKMLIDAVSSSGLSTVSNELEQSFYDGLAGPVDKEITSEMEATAAAYQIFRNVAQPGCSYIDEDDLLRFMIREEVALVIPLFEGAESGRIDRKALIDWVVKVYQGRKALAHALTDTKTAVKQLNKLVTGIVVVVTIIVWLLLMEIATTKVILLMSSQLAVAAFMFGNTCKQIFEAIIFVFVMHPFDVGDRCIVDGVPMLVEEMNILTTVFLKLNNEKVFYPNSVLATKPISNYYRSPDMGDGVEFSIDFLTPIEKIGAIKDKVAKYLEKNPQHWSPIFSLVVKEIENMNKIKMAVYVTHTMNFQNYGEKNLRRSALVLELKKIFEELSISYNLPAQAVHLHQLHVGSETSIPRK